MAERDRERWDERYRAAGPAPAPELPEVFRPYERFFPTSGTALDVACGRGQAAVWLARRGVEVWGLDVSPVAVRSAGELADAHGVAARCRFDVVDLDDGLPPGPPVDVIVCHMFREPRLDRGLVERLAPEGLLAVAALSEVGAGPGAFRVAAGELRAAFATLDVLGDGEADGRAWLVARNARR